MTDPSRAEPEPIEAEYEPADELLLQQQQPTPRRARPTTRRMRSRAVTWPHLITASSVSAVLGASVAIIVSNASSSAPTGTLAREIDALTETLDALNARANQAGVDVVAMRSRLDAQGDRLNRKDAIETQIRTDLSALASQVSAISGAGDGATPENAASSSTPLGVLLARIMIPEKPGEGGEKAGHSVLHRGGGGLARDQAQNLAQHRQRGGFQGEAPAGGVGVEAGCEPGGHRVGRRGAGGVGEGEPGQVDAGGVG